MNTYSVLRRLHLHTSSNSAKSFSSVGFVGLGNMGSHMAQNLLRKGYKLIVYDVNAEAVSSVVKSGAEGAKSLSDVANNSEVVVSMLPSNQHVLDCYTGENGILRSVKKSTLLIDSSTINPAVSKNIAAQATKVAAHFIDGPVSGGVIAAKNGTLTFMVGGTKSNFDNAKPILKAMGSRIVHCGDVGLGQAAKLCNNMLLGITMIGTAEAFNLGEKLGLDVNVLADIINSSSGRCWSSEVYNPVPGLLPDAPSSKNYDEGFNIKLMVKDLGLVQSVATDIGSPVLLMSLATQVYTTAMAHGFIDKDFSVVYQFLKGTQHNVK